MKITKGYSKDHRPDLNQFLIALLCTGGNVPIFTKLEDGNASDKKINNVVLTDISRTLAKVGMDPRGAIYIADAAFVTQDNLRLAGDTTLFISRLPATYGEHQRLIQQAVASSSWQDYGNLAITKPTKNRPGTDYRGWETTVELHGQTYRAVVVHSSAHDRRRQKRLQRDIEAEHQQWSKTCKELEKTHYFCRADADAAVARLQHQELACHKLELTVVETPQYARGRPRADGSRTVKAIHYDIRATLRENPQAIAVMKEQAGCFVLITNVASEGPPGAATPYDGKAILQVYKDQTGIERNFSFLKDPCWSMPSFSKTRTHRSPGSDPGDLPAAVAPHRTEYAPIPGTKPSRAARLGQQTHDSAHDLHDDQQVPRHPGAQAGSATLVGPKAL
jgi:transposase